MITIFFYQNVLRILVQSYLHLPWPLLGYESSKPFLLTDDKTHDRSVKTRCNIGQPKDVIYEWGKWGHTCCANSLVGETTTQRKPHFFGSCWRHKKSCWILWMEERRNSKALDALFKYWTYFQVKQDRKNKCSCFPGSSWSTSQQLSVLEKYEEIGWETSIKILNIKSHLHGLIRQYQPAIVKVLLAFELGWVGHNQTPKRCWEDSVVMHTLWRE